MTIYKLGEIAKMKSGSTPSRKNKDFWTNGNLKWLSSGEIKANVSFSKEKINSKKDPFLKNSVLMAMYGATAGKVGYLGENMYVNQAICVFNCYKNICFNKFLYYFLLKNSYKIKKRAIGGAQQNLSINTISNFTINLPSLKTQKQIIDIIKPYEKLFLNYSQCVRIDNIKNTKDDLKNLINIVKPIENLIKIMKNIILKIENYSKNIQTNNNEKIKINKIIDDYSNGFAYKKEHIDDYGKYKIFTIKNIQNKDKFNKSNHFKKNKLNIGDLITGLSGTIGSADVIGEENWVGNQRTLQLKTKYFLEIKSIIEINKIKLLKKAKGAAQKNISHSDILNLKVFIKKFNQEISNFYLTIKKNIQKIKKIKFLMIDLFIN